MDVYLWEFHVTKTPREVNLDLHKLSWFLVSLSSGVFNLEESNIANDNNKKINSIFLSISYNCHIENKGNTVR